MATLAAPDMGGTGILKGGTMVLSVKPNRGELEYYKAEPIS